VVYLVSGRYSGRCAGRCAGSPCRLTLHAGEKSKTVKTLTEDSSILDRIREQLETAGKEYRSAREELDNLIECILSDVKNNLKYYMRNNLKRVVRKRPDVMEEMEEGDLAGIMKELDEQVELEIDRVIPELRDFPGWYDHDTTSLDVTTSAWKSVKSIEPGINRILKRYNLPPIDMKNWTWLSVETNELVTNRFSEIKKNYIGKAKLFEYLRNRVREETRINSVMDRIDEA